MKDEREPDERDERDQGPVPDPERLVEDEGEDER